VRLTPGRPAAVHRQFDRDTPGGLKGRGPVALVQSPERGTILAGGAESENISLSDRDCEIRTE